MYINNYFNTTYLVRTKPRFTKVNKASNKYITDKKKEFIKKHIDFGRSYHSTPLTMDNDLDYINQKSWEVI